MNDDTSANKQWLFAIIESLSREDLARAAITLWAIWYAKRKIIYDDEYQSPLSTHLFIESYLRDLAIANPSTGTSKEASAKHPEWIVPDAGCVKLNVDATMAKTGPGGAMGVVC
jgi:hypothetical protein